MWQGGWWCSGHGGLGERQVGFAWERNDKKEILKIWRCTKQIKRVHKAIAKKLLSWFVK